MWLQEGEFIDVFLLPFDGLYTALLVRLHACLRRPALPSLGGFLGLLGG